MSNLRSLAARARGTEIVSAPCVPLDEDGDPVAGCPRCERGQFHREPDGPWRCSACSPPILPADASMLTGWAFCGVTT